MSSFTGIIIAGVEVHEFTIRYDRWFFRKCDRIIEYKPGEAANIYNLFYGFRTTAAKIRERMAHAGYDLDECDRYFDLSLMKMLSTMQNEIDRLNDQSDEYAVACTGNRRARFHKRVYSKFVKAVKETELRDWIAAFPEAVELKNSAKEHYSDGPWWSDLSENPLVNAMLSYVPTYSNYPSTGVFNFPGPDWEQFVVAFLASCPDGALCELNVAELLNEDDEDKFEDLGEISEKETWPHKNCRASLRDIRLLSCSQQENHSLQRMCYASIITIMEAYLGDILKREVFSRPTVKQRFVESYDEFKKNKFTISELYKKLSGIDKEIKDALDGLSLHKIDTAKNIFKCTLLTEFPETSLPFLGAAVKRRHDIVHRNGKDTKGELLPIGHSDVTELSRQVELFTREIDAQILDGMQQDIDAERE
ncbi:HEPN/Toprim-associated domain-containing protein [Pantoea agglomerans]